MAENINEKEIVTAYSISKFNIISPFKVRRVINKLRGASYGKAMAQMDVLPNKAARIVEKTLKSAFYNLDATNKNVDPEKVFIKEIFATAGPMLKRVKPRARGRADRIKKRTSHVTVIVGTEKTEGKK